MSPMVGTCLLINATHWRLVQRDNHRSTVERAGLLTAAAVGGGGWHGLALAFDEDTVTAHVDGVTVAEKVVVTSAWSGVAGVGSGRHRAHFDELSLAEIAGKGLTPGSFVLDVAPMGCLCAGCHHPIPYNKPGASGTAAPILHTDGGWAGFVLDNSQNNRSVTVSRLGRYKVHGNKQSHAMNIWDEAAKAWLIPGAVAAFPTVDFASCVADALGFCYSNPLPTPVRLAPGKRYYVVSEEHAGGDAYAEMTDSATSTDFNVRDGRTYMSYRLPYHGVVSGRVKQVNGTSGWAVSEAAGHDLDTSYGPVNFVSPP